MLIQRAENITPTATEEIPSIRPATEYPYTRPEAAAFFSETLRTIAMIPNTIEANDRKPKMKKPTAANESPIIPKIIEVFLFAAGAP